MSSILPALSIAIVCVFCVYVLHYLSQRSRRHAVLEKFNLGPKDGWKVIGCDVNRVQSKLQIECDSVRGIPDLIARSGDNQKILIGELKSRKYYGKVTEYERNQIALYAGMAGKIWKRHTIELMICYGDELVPIEYDQGRYERLIDLVPECRRAMRR